jgi:PRC-barrel domain
MANKDYIINNHLKELRGSEFEIIRDEPDITNWRVIGLQNQEVGVVNDLIFDEVGYRVKYIIVNVYGKPLNLISRLVLIPIELVELLTEDKLVVVSGLTVGHLAALPTYEKDKITTVTEHSVNTIFNNVGETVYVDDSGNARLYQPHAQNDRYYRPKTEVVEKTSVKDEMKENLQQVKETVKKIEKDLDKLEKH